MAGHIVLFGATGYTGDLTARALVARGARPVLAARSAERLERLAGELGGLETRVADVSRPETVRALVEAGDVLVSTVGPFTRWGDPAVEAAIATGATYFDSTGEPGFIRRVFEHHGPAAQSAGCALLTAFGFDWVPGNLAGALALRAAGPEAVRVDVGYFPRGGGGMSGGTQASSLQAVLEPSFAYRAGRLRTERTAARIRTFEIAPGKQRRGLSVGGSEHFTLPAVHPTLRDVEVVLGMAGSLTPAMPLVSGVISAVTKLPPTRAALRAALGRFAQGSTGGPDAEARARSGSTVVAEAFSASGALLQRVQLDGPNGYTFTAEILAWAAMTAAADGIEGTGALGPVSAFGLDGLEAGARQAGLAPAESRP
jgi:short subunit dehydrogenase-like uncharacterized protein